jgi:hypothetical protein
LGNNEVLYRGIFNLDATDGAIGKPVSHLAISDIAQVDFLQMPEGSAVVRGRAICTFNDAVRIEIPFPSQTATKRVVTATSIQNVFSDYLSK